MKGTDGTPCSGSGPPARITFDGSDTTAGEASRGRIDAAPAAATASAQRVAQRLSQDGEEPRLSVSIGIAEFPRDGATIEHLLSAADQSLYNDKKRGQTRTSLPRVEK